MKLTNTSNSIVIQICFGGIFAETGFYVYAPRQRGSSCEKDLLQGTYYCPPIVHHYNSMNYEELLDLLKETLKNPPLAIQFKESHFDVYQVTAEIIKDHTKKNSRPLKKCELLSPSFVAHSPLNLVIAVGKKQTYLQQELQFIHHQDDKETKKKCDSSKPIEANSSNEMEIYLHKNGVYFKGKYYGEHSTHKNSISVLINERPIKRVPPLQYSDVVQLFEDSFPEKFEIKFNIDDYHLYSMSEDTGKVGDATSSPYKNILHQINEHYYSTKVDHPHRFVAIDKSMGNEEVGKKSLGGSSADIATILKTAVREQAADAELVRRTSGTYPTYMKELVIDGANDSERKDGVLKLHHFASTQIDLAGIFDVRRARQAITRLIESIDRKKYNASSPPGVRIAMKRKSPTEDTHHDVDRSRVMKKRSHDFSEEENENAYDVKKFENLFVKVRYPVSHRETTSEEYHLDSNLMEVPTNHIIGEKSIQWLYENYRVLNLEIKNSVDCGLLNRFKAANETTWFPLTNVVMKDPVDERKSETFVVRDNEGNKVRLYMKYFIIKHNIVEIPSSVEEDPDPDSVEE